MNDARPWLLTTMVLLAGIGAVRPAAPSRAHDVPGEYSISATGHHQAAIGGTVEVVLSVEHAAGTQMCTGMPEVYGCYQTAQFVTYFDSAILSTSSAVVTKDPAAPAACTAKFIQDAGGTLRRYVGGCLDLSGANLAYSGPVWHVPFTCISPGAQTLTFVLWEPGIPEGSVRTFVHDGGGFEPAHLHDGITITCVDLPAAGDDDGDGCTNSAELAPDPGAGGDRDPLEFWDYYDVTGDAFIDLGDTLLILAHFGHGHMDDAQDPLLDRDAPDPLKPWRSASAVDGVDLNDALANLKSYGHACMMG